MSKKPKNGKDSKKQPRGGGAGRAPSRDKMAGKTSDKFGRGPMPGGPRKPPTSPPVDGDARND